MRVNVGNGMTLIGARFDADLVSVSEVTGRKTGWPRFFGLPCIYVHFVYGTLLSVFTSLIFDFMPVSFDFMWL